jgi:S1-C subfamily serine protease
MTFSTEIRTLQVFIFSFFIFMLSFAIPNACDMMTDDLDVAPPIGKMSRSVVCLEVEVNDMSGSGSGVIIRRDNENGLVYILTAAHVVGISEDILEQVRLSGDKVNDVVDLDVSVFHHGLDSSIVGNTYFNAHIYAVDIEKDLALVVIRTSSEPPVNRAFFSARSQMGSVEPRAGDDVIIIGNPVAGGPEGGAYVMFRTMTKGIISNKHRNVNGVGVTVWQTDAHASYGTSGSPVFDKRGRVVGIVLSVAMTSSGTELMTFITFFIPLPEILEFLDNITDYVVT